MNIVRLIILALFLGWVATMVVGVTWNGGTPRGQYNQGSR